jgi:hypothetical protein
MRARQWQWAWAAIIAACVGCTAERRTGIDDAMMLSGQQSAAMPAKTVRCDGFKKVNGDWVLRGTYGPVLVNVADSGLAQGCLMSGSDLGSCPGERQDDTDHVAYTWWDYLRGIWPSHQAGRIVAGSVGQFAATDATQDAPVLIFLVNQLDDGTACEQIQYIAPAASSRVDVALMGGNTVTLTPGQCAQVERDKDGKEFLKLRELNELPLGARNVFMRVLSTARSRHLDDGIK